VVQRTDSEEDVAVLKEQLEGYFKDSSSINTLFSSRILDEQFGIFCLAKHYGKDSKYQRSHVDCGRNVFFIKIKPNKVKK
jgi:hypothetical protein